MNIYKIKAADILIESLKLYFSISTILLAGIIAYYSFVQIFNLFFLFSIIFLTFSSIISILNINMMISDSYKNDLDINKKNIRICNFINIFIFILGLLFSIIYISNYKLPNAVPAKTTDQVLIIGNNVTINGNISTKISVEKDIYGNIIKIEINK